MTEHQPSERISGGGPPTGWTPLQRRLHWIVAGLVALQALSAIGMPGAADALAVDAASENGAVPVIGAGDALISIAHTFGGVAIGLGVAWRLRLRHERRGRAPAQPLAVRWVHGGLYAALSVMVLSGSLHWYAGVEAAARWHAIGKWVLLALVAVHLAGAVRHRLRGDGAPPGREILRGTTGARDSR